VTKKIKEFFDLRNKTPDNLVKITWIIFILSLPFLGAALYSQPYITWVVSGTLVVWGFTFSNAYLHRMYYQNHELMMRNQQEMLDQITVAYHLLHEHCPSCGARLKAPEVRQ
jgi:hypothetical protein